MTTANNDFTTTLLTDLFVFILLIIVFYFMYKLYLHFIKYPQNSHL